MKRAILGVLFLILTPPPPLIAQADTVTLQCPDSVKEGGLVAQATFSGCKHAEDNLGRPYCEYRDLALMSGNSFSDAQAPGQRRVEAVIITINATTGGQWLVFSDPNLPRLMYSETKADGAGLRRYQVDANTSRTITGYVYGRGNYAKDGNGSGVLLVAPPGSSDTSDAIAACSVTVVDDDNTAYIGQRNAHPYGTSWRTTPHCYTPDCAWD